MKIQQFSQQGKRSNNEDSIGHSAGLLTVCDGMGGHVSGERASAFVVQAMLEAFADPQPIGKMEIQQQLKKVQTDINQLLDKEPELEKMGTTFTGVFITPDVWYAAHIGDSRIYLFRPSEQKLWHTWDHSLVGELMRTKEITVEAGRFHPMSNRIAKAIIAQKEGKIASASIVKIDNLKAGDILLLCSDGVVEGWGDLELVQLFSDNSLSFEQKCKKLAKQCNDKSKDNNTALVAEIEESDAFNFGNNDELDWTTFAEVEADYKQYLADNAEESTPQKHETPANTPLATHASQPHAEPYYESEPPRQGGGSNKKPILIIAVAVLLLVGLGLFFLLRGNDEDRAFKKCETAAEYKAYIENYGKNAKYYSQAEAKIKELEREEQNNSGEVKPGKQVKPGKPDPSVEIRNGNNAEEAARRSEADEAENQAYNAIQSIQDCDAYLRKYPTGKYALIIWGHGTGWRYIAENEITIESNRAVAIDDKTGSYMRVTDLGKALRGQGLNVIGFDTCFAGVIENIYELKDCSEYITASPGVTPSGGWNYQSLLEKLSQGSFSSQEIAFEMKQNSSVQTTVFKNEKIDELMTAFEAFSKKLADSIKTEELRKSVFNSLLTAKAYKYSQYPCDMYLDIYSMASLYTNESDKKISDAAKLLQIAVIEAAISEADTTVPSGVGVHFIPLVSAQITAAAHSVDYIKDPNSLNQSAFIRDNLWWVPTISGNSGSLLDKLFYTAY